MEERSKFIESHHFVESHQHFSYGTVNPVYQNNVKVRRTYGWLCPFDGYKSNKRFNVQRHINAVHGWDAGVPVDSRTGETSAEKVVKSITKKKFPNTLTPNYSGSDSVRSICSDTAFGSNMGLKWNQAIPPIALSSPACESRIRMPFLESQKERIRQLGYSGHSYNRPPAGPRNDYDGRTKRMIPYSKHNAYSSNTGDYPNASGCLGYNKSYRSKRYLNEPRGIQESPSINYFEALHTYQSLPINPQNIVLTQMRQFLAFIKQG